MGFAVTASYQRGMSDLGYDGEGKEVAPVDFQTTGCLSMTASWWAGNDGTKLPSLRLFTQTDKFSFHAPRLLPALFRGPLAPAVCNDLSTFISLNQLPLHHGTPVVPAVSCTSVRFWCPSVGSGPIVAINQ
jgi:hypothetical protein